ncbi:TlpA family protein disulfide reductase [Inmirania thermothiophila]|uniref:Peroxiredoxin n=1 Tax=Inmirania thermothiophila TaxID=1750597 RepID=A0A3N1Y9B6_9GAMM|nr:TlpA disulfide reductase family protein [Inmirania thermothiophila]ROR35078.1 peroxiredoxin [Inmirania thermothiophila]
MRRVWLLAVLLWAPVVGWPAPIDFALPDLQGQVHRLSDFRGRWVVLNFWATWCPPCRKELPEFAAFHERHKDRDAVVVGLNYEEADPEAVAMFLEDYDVGYLILRAPPSVRLPLPSLFGLPTTFLISPQGELAATHVGPMDGEQLEAMLREAKAKEE